MDFESLFDIPIDDLHTPCYLTDARLLQKNTALLKQIQQRTGCKILLAQKAFSMFSAYPLIRDDLAGTTASGLFEAKLGREHFGKEVHVFSPAYTQEDSHSCWNSATILYSTRLDNGKNTGSRCKMQPGIFPAAFASIPAMQK